MTEVEKVISGGGLRLNLGCGENRQAGFLGVDSRLLESVDIVHNLESFPWPFDSSSCSQLIASHFVEHLKPWLMLDFMNEAWRILSEESIFAIAVPYAGSRGYWQDPTHINGCNEVTFQYFDPIFPLYQVYKPKPWRIQEGFPVYQTQGNLEVILTKLPKIASSTLCVSTADEVNTADKMGAA